MRQGGSALVMVVMLCGLMAAATLGVALTLSVNQASHTQRQWLLHAQAAAEALIQLAPASWPQAPVAPSTGCLAGRCVWQGDAALAREHWQAWLDAAVPEGGWAHHTTWATRWPTLPQARLAHWVESTPSPDGTLLRVTSWVGDGNAQPWVVMQAIWQIDPTGSGGQWLSWREVMP